MLLQCPLNQARLSSEAFPTVTNDLRGQMVPVTVSCAIHVYTIMIPRNIIVAAPIELRAGLEKSPVKTALALITGALSVDTDLS